MINKTACALRRRTKRIWAQLWWTTANCFLLASLSAFAENPEVTISSGRIRGLIDGEVVSYKGVPYASPPVGKLRWRATQPAQPWRGTRNAIAYGSDCMQVPFPHDSAPLRTKSAEDCLYLNLWAPTHPSNVKLPVLVWIHGGGFVNGGSSPAEYDGTSFAKQGIILVSFNYRLGRFGFFAHPALTAEAKGKPTGNFGLLDQIAALHWIHENIAAFGGNPQQVTIFGESAGGYSVWSLLTSPLAKGLVHGAIVESGNGRIALGGERFLNTQLESGPASAESVGLEFAHSIGIDAKGKSALAKLRALSAGAILRDLNMYTMFNPGYSGPMIDGQVVLAEPQSIGLAGAGMKIPIMVGGNNADAGFVYGDTKDALFAQFASLADEARAAYDPQGDVSATTIRSQMAGDRYMLEPARFAARIAEARHVPSYVFRFSYVAQSERSKWPGAMHASEIPYVFNTVDVHYGSATTSSDRNAAKTISAYWAAFARTGVPAVSGQPQWPEYRRAEDLLMNFSNNGPFIEKDPLRQRLDVNEKLSTEVPTFEP